MFFNSDYKELGPVPVDILQQLQAVAPTIDWSTPEFDRSRNDYDDSIWRIVRMPKSVRANEAPQEQTPAVQAILQAFEPVDQWMRAQFPNSVFYRGEINMLSAQSRLPYHRDPFWYNEFGHRLHIPVLTNSGVLWDTEGRTAHFEVGKLYEINTNKFHTVHNHGDTRRLHIIYDLIDRDVYEQALRDHTNTDRQVRHRVFYSNLEECLTKSPLLPDFQ